MITMFVVVTSCGTRKTELIENKKDSLTSFSINAATLDFYKLIQNNTSFDKGYIFIREYQNGLVSKESFTKKDEVKIESKVEIIKKYKYFNVYRTYRITITERVRETEKSDYTILWIGVAFIIVLGIIVYFKLPNLNR